MQFCTPFLADADRACVTVLSWFRWILWLAPLNSCCKSPLKSSSIFEVEGQFLVVGLVAS